MFGNSIRQSIINHLIMQDPYGFSFVVLEKSNELYYNIISFWRNYVYVDCFCNYYNYNACHRSWGVKSQSS